MLLAFERAERETDPVRRHAYLTFVVVGGGPTGVEMAGAVAEMRRYALRRDFRRIDPATRRSCCWKVARGSSRRTPPNSATPPSRRSAGSASMSASNTRHRVAAGSVRPPAGPSDPHRHLGRG